jgi:hypothetical protein
MVSDGFTMWLTNAPRSLDLLVTSTYEQVTRACRTIVLPHELAQAQAEHYRRARKVMVRVDG